MSPVALSQHLALSGGASRRLLLFFFFFWRVWTPLTGQGPPWASGPGRAFADFEKVGDKVPLEGRSAASQLK